MHLTINSVEVLSIGQKNLRVYYYMLSIKYAINLEQKTSVVSHSEF